MSIYLEADAARRERKIIQLYSYYPMVCIKALFGKDIQVFDESKCCHVEVDILFCLCCFT